MVRHNLFIAAKTSKRDHVLVDRVRKPGHGRGVPCEQYNVTKVIWTGYRMIPGNAQIHDRLGVDGELKRVVCAGPNVVPK